MVHILLHHIRNNPILDNIFESQTESISIFGTYLRRYVRHFEKDNDLAEVMKKIILGKNPRNLSLAERLEAAGLIETNLLGKSKPFCTLYSGFFKSLWSEIN